MQSESGDNSAMPSIKNDNPKGPGVRFPPPLIMLFCLLGAFGLHYLLPLGIGFDAPTNLIGLFFVFGSLVILVICALDSRRAGTAIEPWKPTSSIVYSGCYVFSRNPIYLSFCMFLFGVGITADSLWLLLSCIPCGVAIYYVAIVKEEAYLEQKFGAGYLQYKQRVRRWF
ncbi:MAG: isoprenylcysteine carboxylmethyltransferase family protein [Gammaproteobacteria bacterium]|nr:isoprenylcysteine carboxylmethyltransferase family protein [Gammaproteobacteria bacterium]